MKLQSQRPGLTAATKPLIFAQSEVGKKQSPHNANRWTLLHLAASNNHLQRAAALIKSGGQPALRKTTHAGSTPLHMAAREGHLEMCVLLCDNGASLKATNNFANLFLKHSFNANTAVQRVEGAGFLRKRAIERKLERDAMRAQMKRDKNRSDDDGDVENIPVYAKAESGAGGEVGEAQKQGDDETVGDLTDDGSEIF